jgi:hypothetical protein
MYVGHFATSLILAALFPSVPTAATIVGGTWLDLLDGIFTIVGINRVRANLSAGPYLFFDLVFIDWDHSLLMALILSIVWGAFYAHQGSTAAAVAFAASFAHWLCDVPFHNLDLAAYPYSEKHYGWGWWGRFLTNAWVIEGVFSAVCIAVAASIFAKRGVSIKGPAIICAALFANLSPFTSPMKFIAQLGHPADYLLHGLGVTLGFLIPSYIMVGMVDKAQARAAKAKSL